MKRWLSCLVFCAACGASADDLIGTWVLDPDALPADDPLREAKVEVSFTADRYGVSVQGESRDWSYEVVKVDGDTITIRTTSGDRPVTGTARILGDRLLFEVAGQRLTFKRK